MEGALTVWTTRSFHDQSNDPSGDEMRDKNLSTRASTLDSRVFSEETVKKL